METSRSYYEYPATYAAIQTSQTKNYGSLTPAKAKKSWGDLLKITGRTKKQQSPSSVIYAPGLNLTPTPPITYQSSPYGVKPVATPPNFAYQNGHRDYGQYNATYGRSSSNPVVQYRPMESKRSNGGQSMTYGDWFGSVVSRKAPSRAALPGVGSSEASAWENYTQSPPHNLIQLPTAVPVQILNNVCLCPEQLFSTKTKTKKKCKKCGCKIATIRNATTTAASRIRPAIPSNLYQPPPAHWRWSSPVVTQNYAQPYPLMPSSFTPVNEEDTPPHTPETVRSAKSFKSGASNDSNATITRRRIRQPKAIPPPPTAPLPSIPKRGDETKSSIMKQTKSAYQLLEEDKDQDRSTDTDNLSDNAVNESWEILNDGSRTSKSDTMKRSQSSEIVNGTHKEESATSNYSNRFEKSNDQKARMRSLSYSNLSSRSPERKQGTFKSYIPFAKMSKEDAKTNRRKSESSSSIPIKADSNRALCSSRYGERGSSQEIQATPRRRSYSSEQKSFQSFIPKRDDKKVVSIAGQRILFDRGESKGDHGISRVAPSQFSPYLENTKSNETLNGWEEDEDSEHQSSVSWDSPEKRTDPINSREQSMNAETKWSSRLAMDHNTIQEEDEYDDDSFTPCEKEDDSIPDPSRVIEINGHEDKIQDHSSEDASPVTREDFQATLSELLKVKSILKRPNSIDTSSETDSDFYLPTYAEFKQLQRKKKSVQFRPSDEVNLLEDAGESKGRKVSSIRLSRKGKEKSKTQLFITTDESEQTLSNAEPVQVNGNQIIISGDRPGDNAAQTTLKKQEPMEETSTLCPHLNMSQTADLSDEVNEKDKNASPTGTTLETKNNRNNRKYGVTYRTAPIPSRPTVPPPPPPCGVNKIPEPSYNDLEGEDSSNSTLIDELQNSSLESSPCSTPPPLPTSSPPPLDMEDSNSPSFANFKDTQQEFISIESYKTPVTLPNYESSCRIPPLSKIPIFANTDESQTATIRNRRKSAKTSLPAEIPDVQAIYSKEGIRTVPSGSSNKRHYNNPGQRLSFMGSMVEEGEEHIYEELPSIGSSPSGSSISSPVIEKSIFDGASKYEILEFLQDARKRVKIEDDDEIIPTNSLRGQIETLAIEEDEREQQEDPLLTSIYRDGRSSNRSSNSDSSETSGLIRTDKERLKSGEIERTDSGVGSETSKPMVRIRKLDRNLASPASTSSLREGMLNPCDDCDSPVEATETKSGVVYVPLVCRRCSRRRQERKEILLEIVETEIKYGRDLKVMMEQFYRPIQVAGLLTREQLRRIFLNIEELIYHNRQFALQLRDAYEIALDQGDEDLLTVNVAKLFILASPMLHSFQNYCVRQAEASFYLQNLEKERELLRIFLKVSQMENTLLRRMNLHSFLMVPVQRITKYPLLLSRLYKTTPPSHSSREDCRKAREKIEVYLQHINDESRGTSSTKLWRRISMSVAGNNVPQKRPTQPPDCDTSAKIRNVALDILGWNRDEATVIREGRLLCLPPDSGNWTRRGRSLKMVSVQVVLLTLGRPTLTLEEAVPEEGLITPRNLGIKEAALLAFKDHRLSKSALLRDPWLLSKVVLSWDSEGETESFELTDIASKETHIFKDRDSTSTEEWFRLAQFHGLSVGTWRGRRTALANIMINGARRFEP